MKKIILCLIILLSFIVISCDQTDPHELIEEAYNALNIPGATKNDLDLIYEYKGVTISYDSSDTTSLRFDGTIIKKSVDVGVILTVTLKYQKVERVEFFTVIVISYPDPLKTIKTEAIKEIDEYVNFLKSVFDLDLLENIISSSEAAKANVNKATTEREINDLVDSYFSNIENDVYEIQVAYLSKAKENAINDLLAYYHNINPDEYSLEDYNEISTIIEASIELLDMVITIEQISTVITNVEAEINKFNKIDILTRSKEVAILDLNLYFDNLHIEDYTEIDFEKISDLISKAIEDITNCHSVEEVSAIFSDTFNEILKIDSITNLNNAKLDGISELQLLFNKFNRFDYTIVDFNNLQNILNSAINEINNSSRILDIENIVNNTKKSFSEVSKTIVLSNAIEVALHYLTELEEKIEVSLYTESNYKLYLDTIEYGKTNVTKCLSVLEVSSFIESIVSDLDRIERKMTEEEIQVILNGIEEMLFDILKYSSQKVTRNLNFITKSLYNSTIVYEISDETLISQQGVLKKDVDNVLVNINIIVILFDTEYLLANFYVYVYTINSLIEYYDSIDITLFGAALKGLLRNLLTITHTRTTSYDDLRTLTLKTDADLSNPGNIILIYSRKSVKGTWDAGATWNREHVWPQSLGWFTTSGAGSDIHHIRPENPSVNTSRGNKKFYTATNTAYYNVPKESRGDVARILFYLYVRYPEADAYPFTTVAYSLEMLLDWNMTDPVDEWEMNRNEQCYLIQGNRNPFIDYPEFANLLWNY